MDANRMEDELMLHLLALSTEGASHSARALDAAIGHRATLEKAAAEAAEVVKHKIESDKAIQAIAHAVRERLQAKGLLPLIPSPAAPAEPSKSGRIVLPGFLIGVIALSMCSHASPPPEVTPVSHATLDHAAAAMTAGKYASAKSLFLSFRKDTRIDPEVSLGRAAECAYYLHEDQQSLDLCDELAAVSPSSYTAPYLRGKVLIRQGKPALALQQFELAKFYGHPQALVLARELAKEVR